MSRYVRHKKGLVLVAVLWLVVVLGAIVATMGRSSRLDTKVTTFRVEQLRCKWAGRAGLEKAVAILNEDKETTENDSMTDLWATNEQELVDMPLQRCRFTVRIVDESSKLNVNTATFYQLMELPYMQEDIANAIIDWRDSDDMPTEGGAEAGYYGTLEYPYLPRDGEFRSIRELLLVKGVTRELLYGEDTNFNGQLDYNERDGDASPPMDDADGELDLGWIAYLTCYSGTGGNQGGGNGGGGGQDDDQGGSGGDNSNGGSNNGGDGGPNSNNGPGGNTNQGPGNNSRNSGTGGGGNSQNNSGNNSAGNQGNNNNQGGDNSDNDDNGQGDDGGSSDEGGQGAINVNTASEYVLTALLAEDYPNEAETIALEIINYRDGISEGLESPEQLVEDEVISQEVYDSISNSLTVSSDVFTVYVLATAERGQVDGSRLLTEAVIDRSSSEPEILYWYQGTDN